jgi:hypothetical protein
MTEHRVVAAQDFDRCGDRRFFGAIVERVKDIERGDDIRGGAWKRYGRDVRTRGQDPSRLAPDSQADRGEIEPLRPAIAVQQRQVRTGAAAAVENPRDPGFGPTAYGLLEWFDEGPKPAEPEMARPPGKWRAKGGPLILYFRIVSCTLFATEERR